MARTRASINTEEKALIVKLKGQGISEAEIGKRLGRHRITINRAANKPEIRALIEKEAARIITKGLRPSSNLILKLVESAKDSEDINEKKLGFDAAKHITNIAGISGGAPGTVINTMIQVNQPDRVEELSNIQKFLASQWGLNKKEEIIEAEVEAPPDGD